MSRIESEHRRLTAIKGAATNMPEPGSCLPVMQAFWHALPNDARYSLDLIQFAPDTLKRMEGTAKSFDDLEKVRLALTDQHFSVPVLSASQSVRGVSLKLENVDFRAEEPSRAQQEHLP